LSLPGASEAGPDRWYHGDLVCENLLLVDGKLTSALDFGGLSIGDPTIDLHGAWELFDAPACAVFRARLRVDDAEWARGRA
jgi:aminoglycoside phosphotransferase (APT) family kinase protein